jgi:hypothetical protein
MSEQSERMTRLLETIVRATRTLQVLVDAR